jgi:uncharacterized protein (DUF1684 family)
VTIRVEPTRRGPRSAGHLRPHPPTCVPLDGTDFEIRIYDAQAANLVNFDRIGYYDEDPRLVIQRTFRAHQEPDRVPCDFTRTSDSGHAKQVPGIIDLSFEDQRYQLTAFLDGPMLVIVFADATTGAESYAPRWLLRMRLRTPARL